MTEFAPERRELLLIGALIVIGAGLRLCLPGDIEYKADEQYMFDAAMNVGRSQPWPDVGMPSGASLRNPPMSIWLFVVLARMTGVSSPPGLSAVVEVLNIAALVTLALFALRRLDGAWRRAWLWGVGLAAVNPVAVQLQRKIWAQSVLPFFTALLFWAWSHRRTFPGAFFWGLLGALVGQIHMSGFFFAPALLGWTILFGDRREVRWSAWFAGSAIGAIPLIPWLKAIAAGSSGEASGFRPLEILFFRFQLFFVSEPLGLQIRQSLGAKSFKAFNAFPGGTYLAGVLQLLLLVSGLFALYLGVRLAFEHRKRWRVWLSGRGSDASLLIAAVAIAYWLLLTVTTIRLHRHYMLIIFPLSYVLLAYVVLTHRRGSRVLGAMAGAQLILCGLFLAFVHMNEGAAEGDYGVTYDAQEKR